MNKVILGFIQTYLGENLYYPHFILAVLAKMGLGSDFIRWVRTLLNDQQSCVMNNGTTTGTSS